MLQMSSHTYSLHQYAKLLELLPTAPSPKLDPFSASPHDLAACAGAIYTHHARNKVSFKSRGEPTTLPLSMITNIGLMINIPAASAARKTPSSAASPVAAKHEPADGDKVESAQPQQQGSDHSAVLAALPFLTSDALKFQGFDLTNLRPQDIDKPLGATGFPLQVCTTIHQQLNHRQQRAHAKRPEILFQ